MADSPLLAWRMKCVSGVVFLGSLFWCPRDHCVVLLLAVWAIALGILVYSNLADRFLWIPILLALSGLFGLILLLAIPTSTTLAAEEVTLVMFVVSLAVLKKKPRSAMKAQSRVTSPRESGS